MSYIRVIPRDLFNEAKLLKCIGRLVILNEETNQSGIAVQHDDDGPFKIVQDQSDGSLSIQNIDFLIGKKEIYFKCPYNNKQNYPLLYSFEDQEDFVFDDNGDYTTEFKQFCNSIK